MAGLFIDRTGKELVPLKNFRVTKCGYLMLHTGPQTVISLELIPDANSDLLSVGTDATLLGLNQPEGTVLTVLDMSSGGVLVYKRTRPFGDKTAYNHVVLLPRTQAQIEAGSDRMYNILCAALDPEVQSSTL